MSQKIVVAPGDISRWNAIETYVADDSADPEKTDAYSTWWDAKAESGEIIFRLAADPIHEPGGHLKIYTRKNPLGDPSGKRLNRLTLAGGMVNTELRLMSPADTRMWVSAAKKPIVDLFSQGSNHRVGMMIDPSDSVFRLGNIIEKEPILDVSLDTQNPGVNLRGTPLTGLGEVNNASEEDLKPGQVSWDNGRKRLLYREYSGQAWMLGPWVELQ